jgi:hypothetical protein
MKQHEPKPVEIKSCRCTHAESQMCVEVTVANLGDRPTFVVNRVRRIELDPATSTLRLWFSDKGRKPEKGRNIIRELSVPKAEAIEAGGEKTLTAKLPENMTRLVPQEDGGFHLEPMDLTQAARIEVHVAAHDKPFYFVPSKGNLVRQLAAWGTDISTSVELAAPPKQPPTGST